ncbi:MAG: prolipoprotein diacylglyceryl transferase [Clostridia bacterium]
MAIPYSRTIFGNVAWYSVLIVFGILLAIWLGTREEKRLGLPKDTMIDLALIVVPCGIVGARLYYVAMTWQVFAQNPISILYIWEGGVAIYGAVIGGALGAFVYGRRKKLSFWKLVDCVAPGLLLAQAIGRWGNYFNMEAYGPQITNAAFQFFPFGVLIPNGDGYVWHMATFFYESLWNFCSFIALWLLRKRQKQSGNVFCWYLLLYGSGRFIIEQLREDSLYIGSMRVSQYLSLVLCALAAALLLWRAAKGRRGAVAIGAIAAALLLARWFCLQSPWLYGAIAVAAIACCTALCLHAGSKRTLGWLLLPALLDALGLVLMTSGVIPAPFALYAHTVLCSLTLPLYIGFLIAAASPYQSA